MRKLSIKAWAEDDRPREKLQKKGRNALSNAELLAIILGSGNERESAVELSRRILASVNNDLNDLAKLSVDQMMRFRGIGEAKAVGISAALELGRRRKASEKNIVKISSSTDVFQLIHHYFMDLQHEEFKVILLDRANQVIFIHELSRGGITGTVTDPRLIFKTALEKGACGIILCHNHPSGNLQPSQADKDITTRVRSAGQFLEISVLDHLIVTNDGYFSFADEGIL